MTGTDNEIDMEIKLQRIRRAVHENPSYDAYFGRQGLQSMYMIFERNAQDLLRLLEWSTNEDVSWDLLDPSHLSFQENFSTEINRRLHNLLAANASLIDHTRRVIRSHGQAEFAQEYEARKNRIASAGVSDLLRCLRNYMLHYKLPTVFQAPDVTSDAIRATTNIDISDLLNWDGWRKVGRRYLESMGQEVDLHLAVKEYVSLIEEFYQWFFLRFTDLYAGGIAKIESLKKRFYDIVNHDT